MPSERAVERRIVSVLFADLVGFTSLSERLDAEDVATVQHAYFAAVRETLERHGGRVEKFIGDAVVAIFGVPRAREDDAERAALAALALGSAVERVAAQMDLEEGTLRVRVGVNTGEVVYAETEGPERGPVTGDVVNVAARMQAAAPPGATLVGQATMLAVAHAIDLEEVGALELKGKREPVRTWRAVAAHANASRERAMGTLRAPTIGRDRELAMLLEALARARSGATDRFVLVAPPGVGKSRVIWELSARAADALRLSARCRAEVGGPYDVVAQLVRGALGRAGARADADPEAVTAVADAAAHSRMTRERSAVVVGEVSSLLGAGPHAAPSGLEREQRFDAWLDAMDVLAGERPALWLVEDVHWAGGDLLAFLTRAGERPSPRGRLIVTTARPALLATAPDFAAGRARSLALLPLGPVDARALVGALVGDALPDDLVARIVERSDGNPLFIEELLRAWASVGVLVRTDDGWRLAFDPKDVPIPTNVQTIYAAELDDLPAGARAVARRGSVAGRRFPSEALPTLGVSDPDAVRALVARALVSGPHVDALVGDVYAFRHALLRDAGYASLARADRARLHVRFARWLEDAAADRLDDAAELIATQYESALAEAPALGVSLPDGLTRADVTRLASSWLERAAERAWALAAQATATDLLQRSLAHTAHDAVIDRARRLARLGEILAASGDMDGGARVLAEAADLFRGELGRGDGDRAASRAGYASATSRLASVWNQQLRFPEAEALADAALREIGERGDRETAMLLSARATNAVAHRGRWPQAEEDVARALAIAREHADTALELDALRAYVVVENERSGRLDVSKLERTEELARAQGRWDAAINSMRGRATHDAMRGEGAAARALYEAATELASARGLVSQALWIDYARAELEFAGGDWDGALRCARRAIEVGEGSANHRVVARAWFVAAPIAAARGDAATLRAAFDWHERYRGGFPDSAYVRLMVGALTVHLGSAGLGAATAPAPERLERSFDPLLDDPSATDAALTIFDAWLAMGSGSAPRAALDRLARASDTDDAPPLARGTVALVDARVRARAGDGGAEAAARRALGHFRSPAAPWWIARAIATLEEIGAATATERRERAEILRRLGVPPG